MFVREKKLVIWHSVIAMAALFIGVLIGPLQALEHAGLSAYPALAQANILQSYYQGLSMHGVLNALVWTTLFITGFLTLVTAKSLNREMKRFWLSAAGFGVMAVGVVLAGSALLANIATVLYTFYPPMQAVWFFYLGLALVIVGSWMSGWSMLITYRAWRKENPGERTPFLALASLITMVMWQIAALGVAVEVLFLILPWSFGLVPGIDPELSRTLFWFTGHPLVYFWLLPAYISWYGMVPKQAGGKLFSEPMARLAFWLLLLFSIPVGFHHQFADPGVSQGWKILHAILTYAVIVPSLMTMFTVAASLEIGGRARGGKGLLGWIIKLPWKDPSFTSQTLAMIIFAFGGIGGLINASYNINLVIHNTTWVPGHFHLTVGTATTLTFMGVLYWLWPHVTGKRLFSRGVALAAGGQRFVGMAIFGNGMHRLGLLGAPRRTMLGVTQYFNPAWRVPTVMTAAGGVILFISAMLFFFNIIATVFVKEKSTADMPVAEPAVAETSPVWLDNWKPWLAGTAALIVMGYGPPLILLISTIQSTSPGFRVW